MLTMHIPPSNGMLAEPIGVLCPGGPINGPFAAAALMTLKTILAERGKRIAHLYAISAATPAAAMAAIDREAQCCAIWARLKPTDIIDATASWWSRATTAGRLVMSESVYTSTGLDRLIMENVPEKALCSPNAIPLSIMTTDFFTGGEMVFKNDEPAHATVMHQAILASMALVPFLRLQTIWATPQGFSPKRQTREDVRIGLMDGGYRDNLMVEHACRDGMETIFVVDISGIQIAYPPKTDSWAHWSLPLQRAFNVLITTNDQRDFYGAERVNEELAIRTELKELRARSDVTGPVQDALDAILDRMDAGRLELKQKHPIQVHLVQNRKYLIPFDFGNFTKDEVEVLLAAGHLAAKQVMEHLH